MLAKDLRALSDMELEEKLAEFKEEHFRLRFQNVTGQLDNPKRLGEVRRSVARVRTVQRERELGQKVEE